MVMVTHAQLRDSTTRADRALLEAAGVRADLENTVQVTVQVPSTGGSVVIRRVTEHLISRDRYEAVRRALRN
ncbi:hypothetical protein SEA_LISARA_47 [Arthrobacter phage LiSara]|uniref:Uncharacterized protein n=1 Tax=Arthrobacter phage LiSara TaxID=2015860 RepID=A0A222ZHG0_9CAUD|nr:hypothetical protein KMD21_gp47 [Arthrobacter phage LiSara]ASR83631.1 hypothetical protein SEA_LISARA_47 [Arthrobacter phage LiSara]